MSGTTRNILVIAVAGIVVIAGFSVFADLRELGDRLAGFRWLAFAAALGLALLNYGIRFLRWSFYLKKREISVPTDLSALIFGSGFALSITPGKLGELVKSLFLREARGVPVARSAPIVVAERVTDLAALVILALVGVLLYGVAETTVWAGLAVIATTLAILSWPPLAMLCIRWLTAPRLLRRLRSRLSDFYAGLAELIRPAPLVWGTGLAVVAWLAECIGFSLIVAAFPGTEVSLGLATLIYAATTVAGALSFLPGGLLVTEATMTLFLVQSSTGVDEATAVAATILTRLATLWFAVLLGLVALALLRRRMPAIRAVLSEESGPAA